MSTTTSAQPAQLTRNERLDRLPFNKAHRKLLVASGIGWAFDAMDVGLVSFVVAAIAADPHFNLTPTEKSWVLSIGFVGMAIGAGLYWVGLVGTAVLMCVKLVLHRFPIGSDAVSTQELSVRMRDRQELLDAFEGLIRAHRGQIIESNISREEDDICLEVVAKLPEPVTHDEAIAFMKAHSDVTRISV